MSIACSGAERIEGQVTSGCCEPLWNLVIEKASHHHFLLSRVMMLVMLPGMLTVASRSVAKDILTALVDLHAESPPIAHFDIKPDNVLLDESRRAVLTDSGVSQLMEDVYTHAPTYQRTGEYGTLNYMVPEQLFGHRKAEQGVASDIWCFAATVCHMLTGRMPFDGCTILDLAMALNKAQVPPVPDTLPREVVAMLRRCLRSGTSERPTAAEALEVLEWHKHSHDIGLAAQMAMLVSEGAILVYFAWLQLTKGLACFEAR